MGEKEAGKGKTFPYTKEACRCQNCLYHKKGGCVLRTCCCMDERVRAHTCTFAEAMNACFVQIKDFVFRYRLRLAMERAEESGSCFLGKEHKRRFYEGLVRAKRKDNAFAAQIYLLAAAETLWKRAKRCIYTGGICYAGVDMTDAAVDTFVDEGAPNTSNGNTTLSPVGYLEENAFRYYWKLSSLPTIPQNSIVTSSTVSLYQYMGNMFQSSVTSAPVCVYEMTSAWDETITWNTQPNLNGYVVDYEMVSADMEDVYLTWDITRIAKKWYYGAANNGVSFRTLPESGTFENSLYAFFYTADSSSLRPTFTVTYRNSAGLEDYYTYHTQSIGRAGTGYLQDYTSQLTLVRTDITAYSTVLPFTISHVYNDAYAGQMFTRSMGSNTIYTADFSSMTMGYGWKLSVQETVIPVTIGDELYYVYNDSDGTEHYFALVDGTYRDEDGLGLDAFDLRFSVYDDR